MSKTRPTICRWSPATCSATAQHATRLKALAIALGLAGLLQLVGGISLLWRRGRLFALIGASSGLALLAVAMALEGFVVMGAVAGALLLAGGGAALAAGRGATAGRSAADA